MGLDEWAEATIFRQLAKRLVAQDASKRAPLLLQKMEETPEPHVIWAFWVLSARLESELAFQYGSRMVQKMKNTKGIFYSSADEDFSGWVRLLKETEAKNLAMQILQDLGKSSNPYTLCSLAEILPVVASRLQSGEASQICAAATLQLVEAMGKTKKDQSILASLASRLSHMPIPLEAREATNIASLLVQCQCQVENPLTRNSLLWYLSKLSDRLDDDEKSRHFASAAMVLIQARSTGKIHTTGSIKDPFSVPLSAVVDRLKKPDAEKLVAVLVQALGKNSDEQILKEFALDLADVASRLGDKEASPHYSVAVEVLFQVMRKTTDPNALSRLAEDFIGLAGHLEAKEASQKIALVATLLVEYLGKRTNQSELVKILDAVLTVDSASERVKKSQILAEVVALGPARPLLMVPFMASILKPQPCRIETQQLVELLKHPFCVGPCRQVVLEKLARRYGRPFGNVWEFIRFAREQQLDLDLTTPPQRVQAPRGVEGLKG